MRTHYWLYVTQLLSADKWLRFYDEAHHGITVTDETANAFSLDLLFFHRQLRRLIAIELKIET